MLLWLPPPCQFLNHFLVLFPVWLFIGCGGAGAGAGAGADGVCMPVCMVISVFVCEGGCWSQRLNSDIFLNSDSKTQSCCPFEVGTLTVLEADWCLGDWAVGVGMTKESMVLLGSSKPEVSYSRAQYSLSWLLGFLCSLEPELESPSLWLGQ